MARVDMVHRRIASVAQEGLIRIPRLAADSHVFFAVDELSYTLPHDGMIIDNQYVTFFSGLSRYQMPPC